jgi:hypothetical protein
MRPKGSEQDCSIYVQVSLTNSGHDVGNYELELMGLLGRLTVKGREA